MYLILLIIHPIALSITFFRLNTGSWPYLQVCRCYCHFPVVLAGSSSLPISYLISSSQYYQRHNFLSRIIAASIIHYDVLFIILVIIIFMNCTTVPHRQIYRLALIYLSFLSCFAHAQYNSTKIVSYMSSLLICKYIVC